MTQNLLRIALLAALFFFTDVAQAMPPREKADVPMETEANTKAKKKKSGEECKSADECRRHHRCEKIGSKKVCVAPELREIPKT